VRIELSRVSKTFGRIRALDEVDLTVPLGRRAALIGPNSSGKSTLIRVVLGLLGCRGRVRVGGQSPFRHRASLAQKLAYVPQIAPRTRAPVGELVRAVADVRGFGPSAVEEVANRLGVDLGDVAAQSFRDLSGGTKQKVLIALALATRASLYILDEPTASLDSEAREQFFSLFDRVAEDATLVLCSHRLEEIRHLVDHVVALDEGRVVYDGSAAGFLARRATSVVEVCMDNGAYADWLADRRFRPKPGGWWVARVPQEEKMALLQSLIETLEGHVENVIVRDVESVDPVDPHGDEATEDATDLDSSDGR
jgi:ABC-2 type transport system ATP-binding protein